MQVFQNYTLQFKHLQAMKPILKSQSLGNLFENTKVALNKLLNCQQVHFLLMSQETINAAKLEKLKT